MSEGVGGEEATVELDARLCVWRVFGVSRQFTDRPTGEPSWSTTVKAGPEPDDVFTITIGEIPADVIVSIRQASAVGYFALEWLFGGRHAGESAEQTEQRLEELYGETLDVEKKIRGGFPNWVTLEAARPLRLRADPVAKYRWLRDSVIDLKLLDEFAEKASEFLDVAFARVLPSLKGDLQIDRLLVSRRRTYILAPGKAAFALPNISGSAQPQLAGDGWNKLPFDRIQSDVASLTKRSRKVEDLVKKPSHWLLAALSEKGDPLRRFSFAFYGLEILAHKVGSCVEKSVVSDLTEAAGLPIEQLVWPAQHNEDKPGRNLVFRFTLVAAKLSRKTAPEDVASFKEIADCRNKLSHGSATEADVEELPSGKAIDMLRRYISLVVDAGVSGTLP